MSDTVSRKALLEKLIFELDYNTHLPYQKREGFNLAIEILRTWVFNQGVASTESEGEAELKELRRITQLWKEINPTVYQTYELIAGIEAENERLREELGWIPKSNTPTNEGKYLISDGKNFDTGQYLKIGMFSGRWYVSDSAPFRDVDITHYRPVFPPVEVAPTSETAVQEKFTKTLEEKMKIVNPDAGFETD